MTSITISLTNFKNVIDTKTLIFNKGELIHLTGKSGAGKSTVLCAFEWGFYGKITGIKPRSKKDLIPKVQIIINGMTIDREGNDLKVTTTKGTVLTSDAAQGHIFVNLGDKDLWKCCSYLEQGYRNNLLTGSAEDKMKILRDLTYGYGIGQKDDPDYYLGKISDKIKIIQTKKKSAYSVYDSFYEEINKSLEKYNATDNQWEYSEYEIEDLKKIIKDCTKEYKKLSDYYNSQKMYEKQLKDFKTRLLSLSNESGVNVFLSEIEFQDKYQKINDEIELLKSKKLDLKLTQQLKEFIPYEFGSKDSFHDLISHKVRYEAFEKLLTRHNLSVKTNLLDLESLKGKVNNNILYKELEEIIEKKSYIDETIKYIDTIKSKNESLTEQINSTFTEDKNIKLTDQISKHKSSYESKNESLIDQMNKQIEKLSNLSKEMKLTLSKMKSFDQKKYDELLLLKSKHKKSISDFTKKKSHKCPSCKDLLFINEKGSLSLFDDIDIEDTKEDLKKVEKEISVYDNITELTRSIETNNKDILSITNDTSRKLETNNKELDSIINDLNRKIEINNREIITFVNDLNRKIDINCKEIENTTKDLNKVHDDYDVDRHNELIDKDLKFQKIPQKITLQVIDSIIEAFTIIPDLERISRLNNGESICKLLGSRIDEFKDFPDKFIDNKDKLSIINSSMEKLNKELQSFKDRRDQQFKIISEKELLETEISKLESKIDADRDIDELSTLESKLENYRSLEIDWIHYIEMAEKMETLSKYEKEVDTVNKVLSKYELIYDHVKKLSIEPIEKIIESINYRINEHLDVFFKDVSIKVLLSLFKQSSGAKRDSFTKIAVNLQVYHGDICYPNISSLSGGEADRISLALTLTLAEVFKTPILFLDECMASLDADLRETCLRIIKDTSLNSSLTVVDICHESVIGFHDDVILIE